MQELHESTSVQTDAPSLRAALARDGYVFIRGLVARDDVDAAAAAVRDVLRDAGWIDVAGRVTAPYPAEGSERHPAYRAATSTVAFNRLPYLPALRGLARRVLGPTAWPLPSKVLRATPPARCKTEPGRFTHQDFSYWGVNDMVTTWVALCDIPLDVGGLALRPGSHLGPQVPLDLLAPDDPSSATAEYRPGDVVLFHCLTSHAALPNQSDQLRISGDFRWLRVDEPVSVELVKGTGTGAAHELFEPLMRSEPWWTPVPADARLVEGRPTPPGRSTLFPVHASWERWSEPVGGLTG